MMKVKPPGRVESHLLIPLPTRNSEEPFASSQDERMSELGVDTPVADFVGV
jgi:hypothetical protein